RIPAAAIGAALMQCGDGEVCRLHCEAADTAVHLLSSGGSVKPIAVRTFEFIATSGSRRPVTLEIGAPYAFEDGTGYQCPVRVIGLGDDAVRPIGGVDAIQALMLALRFLGTTLPAFAEQAGGRLVWDKDEDLGLLAP